MPLPGILALVTGELTEEQQTEFADHTSSPFVWLEAADGSKDAKGGNDWFCKWAAATFIDKSKDGRIQQLATTPPGLLEAFSFDSESNGTAQTPSAGNLRVCRKCRRTKHKTEFSKPEFTKPPLKREERDAIFAGMSTGKTAVELLQAVLKNRVAPLVLTDLAGDEHPLAPGWHAAPPGAAVDLVALARAQHPALAEADQPFTVVVAGGEPASISALLVGPTPPTAVLLRLDPAASPAASPTPPPPEDTAAPGLPPGEQLPHDDAVRVDVHPGDKMAAAQEDFRRWEARKIASANWEPSCDDCVHSGARRMQQLELDVAHVTAQMARLVPVADQNRFDSQLNANCIASPAPALFAHQDHTALAGLLSNPKRLVAATLRDAATLVGVLGGDVTSKPQCFPDLVLLSPAERAVVIAWLDAEHLTAAAAASEPEAEADLRRTISTATLTGLVGAAAVERLAVAFGGPYNLVKLRRVEERDDSFVAFHTDSHSRRTMQVALNGDAEYRGGRLVFATGAGFVIPDRPAGTATIHTDRIVHGVTALTGGVRCGLFLCDATSSQPVVDLRYLETAVRDQFDFFDKAVQFLDAANEAVLRAAAAEYQQQQMLRGGSGRLQSASVESVGIGVELASRVHKLHPLAYCQATAACLGAGSKDTAASESAAEQATTAGLNEWAGIDLVEAMRRQAGFMRQIIVARPVLDQPDAIAELVRQYRQFLELARVTPEQPLAPTAPIDLVWHTHQQRSDRYGAECVAIAGRFLDHNDEVSEAELDRAAQGTRAAWEAAYGEALLG